MTNLNHDDAARLFGADLIDAEALRSLLGGEVADAPPIPFTHGAAETARKSVLFPALGRPSSS